MIWSALERYLDPGLLVVRIGSGAGFVWFHGLPKLPGGPERRAGTGSAMAGSGLDLAPAYRGVAAAFAGLVLAGPGRFSLDHLLGGAGGEDGGGERPCRPSRSAAASRR